MGRSDAMPFRKALALLTIVMIVQFFGCERIETVESSYATLAEALRAEAVGDTKWIPALLPESARDIKEAHNLDTNEVWLAFELESSDLAFGAERCTRIAEARLAGARKRPARWWPDDLVRGTKQKNRVASYQHYECSGKSFLSIDTANNKAYYWVLN